MVSGGTFVLDRMLATGGEVIVRVGDQITPETIVARSISAERPTVLFVASELGVPNNTISRYLTKKVGSKFEQGDTIARTRRGLRTVSFPAPAAGTLTSVDESKGTVVFSVSSGQNQLRALVSGEVERVVPERGATIRSTGSRLFGIIGFGGEAVGPIVIGSDRGDREVTPEQVKDAWKGSVVVCGMTVGVPALNKLRQVGVSGIIVGSLAEADVRRFLASASGGGEARAASFWGSRHPESPFAASAADAPFVIVATEGFGRLPMAELVFNFLRDHTGETASIQAATSVGNQLRRPEIYVSGSTSHGNGRASDELAPGRPVRLVGGRALGTVGVCRTAAYPRVTDAGARALPSPVAVP
ncbi:MAG: hypothetical protein WD628_06645, partial [Thermomicrobiales bacterium]